MKRSIFIAAAALGGSLFLTAPAAGASPRLSGSNVATASDAPAQAVTVAVVKAAAPTALPSYRVVSGDTLWAIGVRYHRQWTALAAFNHIPNPDLIFVDQVVTIPPASYVGSVPAPAPHYTPPVTHTYTAPVRTYTPPAPQPVVSSYGAPGSFQSCVATRESGNGSGSSNIYGILNSTWSSLGLPGSAYTASRAQQDAAFQQLYARDGTQPWAPYDGC